MQSKTIWEWLCIEPTEDKNVIRKAYAAQAAVYHPEEFPEEFKELQKAYKGALRYKAGSAFNGAIAVVQEDSQQDMSGQTQQISCEDEMSGQIKDILRNMHTSELGREMDETSFLEQLYRLYVHSGTRNKLRAWQQLFENQKYTYLFAYDEFKQHIAQLILKMEELNSYIVDYVMEKTQTEETNPLYPEITGILRDYREACNYTYPDMMPDLTSWQIDDIMTGVTQDESLEQRDVRRKQIMDKIYEEERKEAAQKRRNILTWAALVGGVIAVCIYMYANGSFGRKQLSEIDLSIYEVYHGEQERYPAAIDWNADYIVDGVTHSMGEPVSHYTENGWYFNKYDAQKLNQSLKTGENTQKYVGLYHSGYNNPTGSWTLGYHVLLQNQNEMPIEAWKGNVQSISFCIRNLTSKMATYPRVVLPGGITWGASVEDIRRLYGEAQREIVHKKGFNSVYTSMYYSKEDENGSYTLRLIVYYDGGLSEIEMGDESTRFNESPS